MQVVVITTLVVVVMMVGLPWHGDEARVQAMVGWNPTQWGAVGAVILVLLLLVVQV